MLLHILQISLIFNVASIALAEQRSLLSKAIMEGLSYQINNSIFKRVGDKLYYFSDIELSWYNALLECRHKGASLASIESATEMEELSNYLADTFYLNRLYWLSGSDVQSEGNFAWYNTGKLLSFSDWTTGQPDNYEGREHCILLKYDGRSFKMNDIRCEQKYHFICETKKPEALIVTLY